MVTLWSNHNCMVVNNTRLHVKITVKQILDCLKSFIDSLGMLSQHQGIKVNRVGIARHFYHDTCSMNPFKTFWNVTMSVLQVAYFDSNSTYWQSFPESAPTILSSAFPCRRNLNVGIAEIPSWCATSWQSSTSIFKKLTAGYLSASSSYTGAMALHGPHLSENMPRSWANVCN